MQRLLELAIAQSGWLAERATQLASEVRYQEHPTARQMNWRTFINSLLPQLSSAGPVSQRLADFATDYCHRHRAMGVKITVVLGLVKVIRQCSHELIDRGSFNEAETGLYHQQMSEGFDHLEEVICQAWFLSREDQRVAELEQTVRDLVGQRVRYEAIFHHVPEPILVLDHDGRIQTANPAAEELLSSHGRSLIGRRIGDAAPWLERALGGVADGHSPVEVEPSDYGGQRHFHVKVTQLPALIPGRSAETMVVLTDVSPLKRKASQLLRTTEELTVLNDYALELADASIEAGICWLVARRLRALTGAFFCAVTHRRTEDGGWRVYAVDAAADDLKRIEELMGRSPVDMDFRMDERSVSDLASGHLLLIHRLHELAQGCLTSEQAALAEATLSTGECYALSFLYKGQPIGTAVFVMPKSRPLDRSKASMLEPFAHLSAIALQRAISDRQRQRAESALVESEARYRELFATSCDGIVVLNPDGQFVDCNKAYLDLLGYETIEELRTKTAFEVTPPEYHALDLRAIAEALASRGYSDEYEKEYYRRDGTRVPVSIRSWSPRARDTRPTNRWAIVRDVSPLRQMEESSNIMEKYRILGELAAAISHEVRNPLTTVRGFLQHFSSKPTYSAEDKEFFELMIKELDSATTIISDFLETARPSRMKVQDFDLVPIVLSLCRVMESRAVMQKVEMIAEAASPLLVRGDLGQIRQVLINILQNALQAMPTGGTLSVRCSIQDGMARIEITDTGTGIPPENLEKIGRPFFTTKPGGSGLGLSTCFRIMGAHRGRIEVASEAGKGTTFACYLPLVAE